MAIPDVSAEKLEEAFDRFDQTQRALPIFQNWESNENYRYAVLRNGRRYPPKDIVAFATGLSKDSFSGGVEGANAYLQKHRYTIEALRLPADGVLQAALHDLLLLRAPESVEPSEAYEVLADKFGLSAELRNNIMENQNENHWKNRVRFARRKLVSQNIIDPSEQGNWKLQRRAEPRVWLEKTLVKGRPDRLAGDHALGKALWSPTRAKDGADIYRWMRLVQPGDRILHLTDNTAITGMSVAAAYARPDFLGVPGTVWGDQPSYWIALKDFQLIEPPLARQQLLSEPRYRQDLIEIRKTHANIFYDRDLNLNQGSYLTEVPAQLVAILNDCYASLRGGPLLSVDSGDHSAWQHTPPAAEIKEEIPPHIWVYSPGERATYWDEFRENQIAAIGWDELGDLSAFDTPDEIFAAMEKLWNEPSKINSNQCFEFSHRIQPGDWIFAKRGRREIIGFGVVNSDYRFDDSRSHSRHVVDVDWQKFGAWPTQSHRTLPMKTLTDITGDETLIDELEQMLALTDALGLSTSSDEPLPLYSINDFIAETRITSETAERWRQRLERKKQLIFQGPPGTGKTFVAERLARLLASGTPGLIETIQFHPSYGYEDFMHGIRPVIQPNGQMAFERLPGRFLRFCKDARAVRDGAPCILIIDEINRGNLARIFGELMYLLEYREKQIPLAGEAAPFGIPNNVFIIGTMNTADRSIAVVDHALRRRFSFIHLAPDYDVLHRHITDYGLPADALIAALRAVNTAINDRNYEVGISFFLKDSGNLRTRLKDVWEGEIEPYLEEYFYDQPSRTDALRWPSLTSGVLAPWVNAA